jgi:hypothetical protein
MCACCIVEPLMGPIAAVVSSLGSAAPVINAVGRQPSNPKIQLGILSPCILRLAVRGPVQEMVGLSAPLDYSHGDSLGRMLQQGMQLFGAVCAAGPS